MMKRLAKFLRPETRETTTLPKGQIALAALLVRVARADHEYTDVEAGLIDGFIAARFALDTTQAAQLRRQAERYESQVGDTVHLTRLVKDIVPLDDRAELLVQMWQIILSDDARHDEENGLMRLVCNLLGLADRDSALARQRAATLPK